jgi:hypothetical protein
VATSGIEKASDLDFSLRYVGQTTSHIWPFSCYAIAGDPVVPRGSLFFQGIALNLKVG